MSTQTDKIREALKGIIEEFDNRSVIWPINQRIEKRCEAALAALSEIEAQPSEPRLTVDQIMGLFDEAVDAVTEPGDDEDTQHWIDIKDVAIEFRDRLTKAAQ